MAKATSYKDYRVGMTVRIKNSSYVTWGYNIGDRAVVTYVSGSSMNVKSDNNQAISVALGSVEPWPQSKENIEEEVKRLEGLIEAGKSKLKWLEETEGTEYDPDEHKVWEILNAVDGRGSNIKKAQKIAALLRK